MKRVAIIVVMVVVMVMPALANDSTYLNFTAINGPATILLSSGTSSYPVSLQYSTDSVTWNAYTLGDTINLASGQKVYFKADSTNGAFMTHRFYMTGTVAADGNIMSLLDATMTINSVPDSAFYQLFYHCNSLIKAPALPATTLAEYCYSFMFDSCTSLTQAPALPATKLADGCYSWMFSECSSLTQAPALPATKLADYCYLCMFSECSSLTQAPTLPATTLADGCYSGMFEKCKSLTQAPVLPATTLADGCYNAMFWSCTSLTQAPALPATKLADDCYDGMFYGCKSLTQAPALPATTLADFCYNWMFWNCRSLTQAPALPATTLANFCYSGMFWCCTSLTQAPALPATTLASNCYAFMFSDCYSLTTIPALPATTLADSCYYKMFDSCTSLEVNLQGPGVQWVIPATAEETNSLMDMFKDTGGTMNSTPSINTIYYLGSYNVDTTSADVNFYFQEMYESVQVTEYHLVMYKVGGNDTADVYFSGDTSFVMQRIPRVIVIVDSVSGTTTTVTISINHAAFNPDINEVNVHLEGLAPNSTYSLTLEALGSMGEILDYDSCSLTTALPSSVTEVYEDEETDDFFPTEQTDVYTIDGRYVGKYHLDLPPGIYLMRENGKWHKFGKSR